ncbi:MAG TPA: amino acid adenylation domain-containing protein, partial [Longimicrobium sp.]
LSFDDDQAALEYATDLFEPATAQRMLAHLERVLEQVAADPDARLSQLELLGGAERALVLEEWNRTTAEYPAELCIHELFEAQAARTPDAVAVLLEGRELTYAVLNARANRLAHHLRALGVGPDARVAIAVERGPEMVVGLLSILKAGGAYVPLDPAYPADRLRYMLEDSAPAALLVQSSLAPSFAGVDVPSVVLDAGAPAWAGEPETNPGCAELRPDHLAYVIYTSGSTGRPKGVLIEHRSLVNHTAWQAGAFGIGADDTVLQRTSISFDASAWELWTPLATGARLLLLPPGAEKDPGAIGRVIGEGGATIAQFVPTLLQAVLGALPEGGSLPCRIVFCGGEPLPASLVEEARAAGAGEVVNLYGPTEATIDSTAHACGRLEDRRAPSIGRPIANARIYVLDARGEPVPVGVAGELYVGGAAVARGYLGRPVLSAERFVPDPFSGETGARMYRTGDRARWTADGTLEFLGRTDHQVKIRGFRIEPGEVEAALRRHDGVRECVVVAREDPGDRRLAAYVVAAGPDAIDAAVLREHLRRSLPEHMVPGAFVVLDRLPLTPNGKVDRKALPAPELASAEETYVAPRTPVEEMLAGIWAEVLRLERVGVRDNFFELGGHSLLAMRVVSRVRAVFDVELPLRAVFEGPTVARLAVRVEEMRRAELPVLPPVAPVERTGPQPLSFAQERLWFLHGLKPESAFYNVAAVVRLSGALDAAALERALDEVVRRHESLRTTFRESGGAPVQVIAPHAGLSLPVEDLSGLGEEEREAAAGRRAEEEAARPFDLAAGPLFRPALLRLGADDHVLLLCMHHIVSDEWSTEVLFREMAALYAAFREGRPSPLAELPVQYADYASWQREHLRGEVLERQLAWWRERLAGAPALLELPTDRPRPAAQSFRGATLPAALPAGLLARVEALGRGAGATRYMVLLAAFQVLLAKYSGSDDVVVGTPVAGQTRREVEELIGFFTNTLVLRTDLSGDPTFREVLRRVRETTLGAWEHQDVPFERLVEELRPERSLSHSPLFQVMFVQEDADRSQAELPGVEMCRVYAESGTSKFDLTLSVGTHPEGIRASLEYSTDLFDRATAQRMLGHLLRVLEQVTARADARLSDLELTGEEERRLVVEEWNRTEAGYPAGRCIQHLFEAQAERTPGAVAVRHAGGSLTYGELEERANRLARHLRGLGVGPDARVGLCLERGPELMIAVLGILKAGGAYVPLDPAYPAERLGYMLEDSAARVLLTQASLAERLPAGGATVVRLGADAAEIGRESGERLRVPAGPGNLAYVIYTSGSTGRPKGVAMPHRPLVNLLAWQAASGHAPVGAVTLQYTSISFDVSFQEIFATWCAGGTLVLVSEEVRTDSSQLARLVEAEGVERLFLPFVALQHLAEASVELGIAPASLAEVITAGEQLRVTEPIRRWFAAMPGCVLVNQYGPSETHVVSAR